MNKLRSILGIVLTAAVIAACACFPQIVSRVLDQNRLGQPEYLPMDPIRLEIRQELTSLGKLAVLSRADMNIEISESKTAMTREQALEAAHRGLAPYTDTMLLSWIEETVELKPNLFQVQNTPELQTVVWLVSATNDPPDAPNQFTELEAAIDDETGKILALSFTSEETRDLNADSDALAVFAEIFFSGLGIEDYGQYLVPDLESAYVGETGDAVRYQFTDSDLGSVTVDLYVHAHGFYVEFPNQ